MSIKVIENLLALTALIFILWSLHIIYLMFTPIQFWDQWQMVNYMAQGGNINFSYLLKPHNEHIIATSKILYFIDYYFFDYSNVFLIISIVTLHLAVAYTTSWILFGSSTSRNKIVHFLVIASMMLSLGQWENLVIGFQTQFGLTALFALLACYYGTLTANKNEDITKNSLYTFLFTSLTIFSMGNGVALILSFIAIIVISKKSLRSASTLVIAYAAPFSIYFLERNSELRNTSIGDAGLFETVKYFFTVLGATFTTDHILAVLAGVGVTSCFVSVFAFTVFLPMMRGETATRRVVVFTAVSVFCLGSSAAVAVGRVSLGIDSAFTSRYATPNFLLYASLLSTCCAHSAARLTPKNANHRFLILASLIGLSIAAATTFKSETLAQMTSRSEELLEAGYFIKSGSVAPSVLEKVFPVPDLIIPSLSFLKENKLNVFSERFGLSAPPEINYQGTDDLKLCENTDYSVSRLDENTWMLAGEIDQTSASGRPAWIVSVDAQGRYNGYAPMMAPSGKRFRYSLPIHLTGVNRSLMTNVAVLNGQGILCKFEKAVALPKFKFEEGGLPSAGAVRYKLWIAPPSLSQILPAAVKPTYTERRKIISTWQGDDTATGKVVFQKLNGAQACEDAVVGVMRGPSSEGVLLEITGDDGNVEQMPLKQVSAHEWHWLTVGGSGESCQVSKIQKIELIDNGTGWGAWGAISLPPMLSD